MDWSALKFLQWRRWRHFRNMKTRCFLSLWMMMACSSQLSKWISTREFCLLFVFTSIFADFGSQGIEYRKSGHKLSEDPLCYKRSFVDFFSPSYQHNRSGRGGCHLLFFWDIFKQLNWVLKHNGNWQESLSLCGVRCRGAGKSLGKKGRGIFGG